MGLFYLQGLHDDQSQPVMRRISARPTKWNLVPVSRRFMFSGLFFQKNFGRFFSELRDYLIKPGKCFELLDHFWSLFLRNGGHFK